MASKTQIDRLGDRLRSGQVNEDDLRMLDEYRRSFSDAYEFAVGAVRSQVGFEPTGRPAKSTTSITEKLIRESIRLSQIQDIAGCRVVVSGIADQERALKDLCALFKRSVVVDRRERPNNGYRAVHIIVNEHGKLVEIQVRTTLQHAWAELSEKVSDLVDADIKYGGGEPRLVEMLQKISEFFGRQEYAEFEFAELEAEASRLLSIRDVPVEVTGKIDSLRSILDVWRKQLVTVKNEIIEILEEE